MWTRTELFPALLASSGLLISVIGGPAAPRAPAQTAAEVSFSEQIRPILDKSCIQCHGGEDEDGNVTMEAGLDMTTYEKLMVGSEFGTVVEPGDPDESMMVVLIEDGEMPGEGDLLEPEQIELIRTWIAEGAKNN